jgi:ketosteroid isomerase-like protein
VLLGAKHDRCGQRALKERFRIALEFGRGAALMKLKGFWVLAIFLAGILFNAGLPAYATSSDEAQIKALEAHLVAGFRALDIKSIMECYVLDDSLFAYDANPPRQFVGPEAYKKDWEGFLTTFPGPVTVEMSDLKVTNDAKLGFGHSIIHFVGTNKDGKKVDLTLRVTDGYRKIKGKWLIVEEHSSVPVDFDTGKADFTSKP